MGDEKIQPSPTMAEVKQIPKVGGHILKNLGEIDDWVEEPLKDACRYLWNSGIKSEYSHANLAIPSENPEASIYLSWNYLSDENKSVFRSLVETDPEHFEIKESETLAVLKYPFLPKDIPGNVSTNFLQFASHLKPQIPEWTYLSENDLQSRIKKASTPQSPTDRKTYIEGLVSYGHYYDESVDRVYFSKDLFDLTKNLETKLKNSISISELSIQQRIEIAKSSALPEKELESLKDKQDSLTNQFLKSEMTLKQFGKGMEKLDNQSGVVKFTDLAEFNEGLTIIGLDEETIKAIMDDEVPHFAETEKQGIIPIPQVQFLLTENGMDLYPSIGVDFPDDMPDDKAREILRNIIEAQKNPSPRDKKQLGIE